MAAAVALVLVVLATGCGTNEPQRLHGQVPVTFLHTADIHSRLFPYDLQITHIDNKMGLGTLDQIANVGGAARISYIVNRERARAERALHVETGDSFQGAPVFNFYSGEAEMRALGAMGLDVSVVGNHEFDHGALNLGIQIQNWASFSMLIANYLLEDPAQPGASPLGAVCQPYHVVNLDGLRVGLIGLGALSSLSSIYDQPNRLGVLPLKTTEVVQFYVDQLRPIVDLVVVLSHLGLHLDKEMINHTEGIDVVFGGHNHIVLQPPQKVLDCRSDKICVSNCEANPGGYPSAEACIAGECNYIEIVTPDGQDPDEPSQKMRRRCTPREVVLAHSGAFGKYVGRLDVVSSDDPADFPADRVLSPINGFEVVSHKYRLFPVNESVPDDPTVTALLEPYAQGLDQLANLEMLVGYAPYGSLRMPPVGGDSPLGNLIATAMWLRLGVQTDFALTNTTGIRANIVPGSFDVEQMYNIFPFDNSIAKMQLSGKEVQELFDYVARRSAGRGCVSQVQIAGARVVLDCEWDDNPTDDIPPGKATGIYIGATETTCTGDQDCPGGLAGSCDSTIKRCWRPIDPIASYEMATSNYLANGGSGFRVLQRNTTQFDTKIQQRDALIDYIRAGRPCGADADGNPTACATDADCEAKLGDGYVCACPGAVIEAEHCATDATQACPLSSGAPEPGDGACVAADCRDHVAAYERGICDRAPNEKTRDECLEALTPCASGGEQCKFLTCLDVHIGNNIDGRIMMVGK